MKLKWITPVAIASFVFASAQSASAFIILAETHTDDWAVSRNLVLTSGTTASGSVTSSAIDGVMTVSQYTGFEQLARVVIRVVQPEPTTSQNINAEITIASGSDTFTSSGTQNRVSETSRVFFSSDLNDDLDLVGASGNNYVVDKFSTSYANATINVSNPVNRTVNIANGPTVLFDSDNFSITEAQLQAIFAGSGSFEFAFETTSDFRWARSGTAELTATLSGINSGQIIIEYYVVPEPSAALLGGLGMLALLRRRR